MSKTRTSSKPKPHDEPSLPKDLVANMLASQGGPAAEAFALADRAPARREFSRGRASERAALVSDILDELEAEEAALSTTPRKPKQRRRGAWSRASFNLSDDLMEQVRNASHFLAGQPEALNHSRLTEGALRRELHRLRQVHRSGEPFPKRPRRRR